MFNQDAKSIIDKLQYIIDRFVKVRFYSSPKKIINEPHTIETQTDGKYISFLSEIVSDKGIHEVRVFKEGTIEAPYPDFAEYTIVKRNPVLANECYVDKKNNILFFHSSQKDCNISVSYYSIGVGMLSTALIYTHMDSNERVTETLFDLTRKCQVELDRVSTINDAEQLKVELRAYIDTLLELMRLYPNPQEIIDNLGDLVALGDELKIELGLSIEEAKRLMDELKDGSNKAKVIAPVDWVSVGQGRYKYEYSHGLGTMNLIIETAQLVNNVITGSTSDYEIPSANKVIFYTSDNTITLRVIVNASYYMGTGGGSSEGTVVVNADNVIDGIDKVSMTKEERETLVDVENKTEILNQGLKDIDIKVDKNISDIEAVNTSLEDITTNFKNIEVNIEVFRTNNVDWADKINELILQGRDILIPNSIIEINKPIVWNGNVTIKGVNKQNSVIRASSTFVGDSLIKCTTSETGYSKRKYSLIDEITLDCDRKSDNGIYLQNGEGYSVSNINIINFKNCGMKVGDGTVSVNACDFSNILVAGDLTYLLPFDQYPMYGIYISPKSTDNNFDKIFGHDVSKSFISDNAGNNRLNMCHGWGTLTGEKFFDYGFELNAENSELSLCFADSPKKAGYYIGGWGNKVVNSKCLVVNANSSFNDCVYIEIKTGVGESIFDNCRFWQTGTKLNASAKINGTFNRNVFTNMSVAPTNSPVISYYSDFRYPIYYNNSTFNFTFPVAIANTSYSVFVDTGFDAGAYWVEKTTTGFTVRFSKATTKEERIYIKLNFMY